MRAAIALGLLLTAAVSASAQQARRSSYEDMSPSTRAIQDDDTANPAMLWVLDGEALWRKKDGEAKQACSDCHPDAAETMRGVAARYPAFDARAGGAMTLEARINLCRTDRQKAAALAYESKELLALSAFIARQSRGLPIARPDARLSPVIEDGRKRFHLRQGQLNLSCANCHDDNAGGKLAGNTIPQGHPTAYPLYRLEWQTLGSLQRRLRNCLSGMRAENHAYGSPELDALETYLAARAQGMTLESPGVRP